MRISGNTIFIPGATSGFGRALAVALHDAGNKVIIGGRRGELLAEIADQHSGIEGVIIDVCDPTSIEEASARVMEAWPETNVLINMAGVMQPEDFTGAGFLPVAEATIITNVLGPLRLIAAFTSHLGTRQNAVIVNVGSGLASVPLKYTPTYNASKAAIHMLSESMRLQLNAVGVEVLEIVPPAVATTLMNLENDPRAMPLDDFIAEVMDLLAANSGANELLVENVKGLRFAEVRGEYDQVVAALNGV